jgi:hypothetical protein
MWLLFFTILISSETIGSIQDKLVWMVWCYAIIQQPHHVSSRMATGIKSNFIYQIVKNSTFSTVMAEIMYNVSLDILELKYVFRKAGV